RINMSILGKTGGNGVFIRHGCSPVMLVWALSVAY
ncbi:MAG: hypothetical protein ACI9I4_001575, partial [Neolewinella sp.]